MTTTFKVQISREVARQYGLEALKIIQDGGYQTGSGRQVDLSEAINQAVLGTVDYPPEQMLTQHHPAWHKTKIEVCNETTLSAVQRLLASGCKPAALNFASATHPGGGFLEGARAQEEYLARSSGLFACLKDQPMYAYHRQRQDALYTSHMLYSPNVPVFRSDDGDLLEAPYTVAIITAAAPNAKYLPTERQPEIRQAFRERIAKLLWIGIQHGHDAIVLGAWGCGAFGNDSKMVSQLFHDALVQDFQGAYQQVVFAIVDWSDDERYISPFANTFRLSLGA